MITTTKQTRNKNKNTEKEGKGGKREEQRNKQE